MKYSELRTGDFFSSKNFPNSIFIRIDQENLALSIIDDGNHNFHRIIYFFNYDEVEYINRINFKTPIKITGYTSTPRLSSERIHWSDLKETGWYKSVIGTVIIYFENKLYCICDPNNETGEGRSMDLSLPKYAEAYSFSYRAVDLACIEKQEVEFI